MASQTARIAELEAALRSLEKERDDLAADVEKLCLQSGSSMFDPNYLLTERLRSAETEVKNLRQQLFAAKEERESILEELQIARTAKVSTDRCAAELSERCKSLERDVAFYKERAVKAMAERDQEIEDIRAETAGTQAQLQELTESLKLEQVSKNDLEAQVAALQSEVAALKVQQQERLNERKAAGAAAETELRQLRDTVLQLEDAAQKNKTQLVEVQAEAAHTHKLLKQAHKIEDQLTSQVRELQAELAAARRQQSSGGQSPYISPTGSQRSHPASVTGAAGRSQTTSPAERSPPGARRSPSHGSPVSASPAASPAAASPASMSAGGAPTEAATPGQQQQQQLRHSEPAAGMTNAAAAGVSSAVDAAPAAASAAGADAAAPPPPAAAATAAAAAAGAADGSLADRLRDLEVALVQAREELTRERAVHEDEREQLRVLRTMAHDFKIKLAQATQEKVEALMKAAQLAQSVADAKQQQQEQMAAAAAAGAVAAPTVAPHRQNSASDRSSRDFSRSPGGALHLPPASSTPNLGTVSGQSSARSLWTAWLGGGAGGGWHSGGGAGGMPPPAPAVPAAGTATGRHADGVSAGSQSAPSVASEEAGEGAEPTAASAAASAAVAAAAHAATVEAAEGRSRRLAAQLERVRSQLAAVDRLAGHVGRCEAQLRSCATLLWSSREEDAPRRWAALGDLSRLAEECSTMRREAGLPPPAPQASPAAAAAGSPSGPEADLPPVVPLPMADADPLRLPRSAQGAPNGDGGGGGAAGEYDSSLVCTREAGGVQRRVAEVLVGTLEFGVRSLEQYNHQSAMSSVLYS